MKAFSKEALLKPRPRRSKTITIPDDFPDSALAGSSFQVIAMTAGERGRFDVQFEDKKSGKRLNDRVAEIRERLVIATACDLDGQPLFSLDDLPALKQVDVGLINLMVAAAMELNEISPKDIEELAKN